MITFKYDEQVGILKSVWSGDVHLDQIIYYIDSVRTNKDLPRKLKIVSDSRNANFILVPEDLPKIVEANIKSLAQYDAIIDGMVTSNPYDTAMSALYLNLSALEKYFFKVFSTPEAALIWLKSY
ncbi:MAG: hypothetical protein K9H49_19595 [Bacteroidales bacterium]|nr:hypothetical protein [Bacteroidales bacterium]MCF8391971.1 hypothetical protein [Bacteroidales bacterium]